MSLAAEAQPARRQFGRTAKAGVAWGAARLWSNELILIPTSMILARLLSPHDFGIVAAGALFTGLVGRATTVGFDAAIVRAREVTSDHTSSVFVVSLVRSVVICAALALAAPWIGAFFDSPETAGAIRVGALAYPIGAFGVIPGALIARNLRYGAAAAGDVVSGIIGAVVSIVLAWNGYGFWSLVYGGLAGSVSRVVMVMYLTRWWPSFRFSVSAIRELLSFGLGFQARNLLEWSSGQVDNIIVGRMLGLPALGLYDKAYSAMTRFVSRINAAGPSVSLRIFSIIHEERQRFRLAYRKVILGITLVGYPVLAAMAASAPQLFVVLFGSQWLEAVVPFQILCIAGMMRLLNTYASSATQAKGLVWSEVRRQALYALMVAAVAIAGSRWGIAGVACGVGLATAVMTCLMQRMVKRLADLEWSDILSPQVPGAVCAVGLIGVMLAAKYAIGTIVEGPSALAVLALQCAGAAVFYAAFLFASGFPEVRTLVQETLTDFAPQLADRVKPFWPDYSWSTADRG